MTGAAGVMLSGLAKRQLARLAVADSMLALARGECNAVDTKHAAKELNAQTRALNEHVQALIAERGRAALVALAPTTPAST